MVQLDPEDVIPTPQEQINWNALTQSETDEFDQMLRDMTLIPSPLWDQDLPAVRAVPADEGDLQNVTSAQKDNGKGKDGEGKGEEEKGEKGKGEEDQEEKEEKEYEEKKKKEKEEEEKGDGGKETPETPRTDAELLALPFEELTLTEFERVERIFLGQSAAADAVASKAPAAAEAAKATKEAETAAEAKRKPNKEEELELLKIPFSKLSLTQFEDVERLFLNGGVPAELIPPIPTRRAPAEEPKHAEMTKAKEVLGLPFDGLSVSDLEEVQSSFSDVEMLVMPILHKEQTERYVIHWFGRFYCRRKRKQD